MKQESDMASPFIRIDPLDNVATALKELATGTKLAQVDAPQAFGLTLTDTIAFGHKFAVEKIPAGAAVIKYGATIGRASRTIRPGEHVHVHNTESNRGRGDLPAPQTTGEKAGGRP